MPFKNVVKANQADTFYHVYARGHHKDPLFCEDKDYGMFIYLLKRHLGSNIETNTRGVAYENLHDKIELNCYCLMINHIHLLLYQMEPGSMGRLMKNVMGNYSRYFNNKYHLVGSLFESTYRANPIDTETQLLHTSRYIHLNPSDWRSNRRSSISYYNGRNAPDWFKPDRVLGLFSSTEEYMNFASDLEDYRNSSSDIKKSIAEH